MASTTVLRIGSDPAAPYGPDHFNKIINQAFLFINEEGSMVHSTIYKAAHTAEAVGKKLQERVVAHYNSCHDPYLSLLETKTSEPKRYDEEKEQYDKLDELCNRINAVVMLLKQDIGAFKADENSPTSYRIISTLDDVKYESKELKRIAVKIKAKFLTGGSIFWYIPDYLKALEPKKL